jgi:Zn-dependent peptidase ImmA (M78 family)/DNA-binding XRE family transcriptional regulator
VSIEVRPDLIRVAREAAGLTQGDVADRLEITQVTISRWENNLRTPDDSDIARLADLYCVTPSFFRAPAREAGLTAGDLHYRRKARVKVFHVKRLEAVTNWLRIGATRILNEVAVQPTLDIPYLPVDDHAPEEAARHIRRYWQLPIGPIDNLTLLLELAGVIIVLGDFPADGLDGVSMWSGPWPIMYLSRAVPIDRRRFTMAHELGHLVVHREYFDEDHGEDQANRFAAELLMPAEQIRPRLRRLTLRVAANLKLEWRVSITALIQRAKDVGAITKDDAIRLHKQRSARGWTRHEPLSDQLPNEIPTILPRVRDILEDAGYAQAELEELLYTAQLSRHPAFAMEPGSRLHLVR